MIRSLVKRSSSYFVALSLAKVASTASVIWIARALSPAEFGVVMLFTNFLLLSSFVGDFGLGQWFQKEAATKNESELIRKLWGTRLFMVVVSMLVVGVITTAWQIFTPLIIILLLTAMTPSGLISAFSAYYLVKQRPLMIALSSLFGSSIILASQYLFAGRMSVEIIAAAYWVSMWATAAWFIPWSQISKPFLTSLQDTWLTLKESSSYAVLIVTSFAYARADSFIVNFARGSAALGYYSAGYRYLDAVSILPNAVYQNLFPIAAKEGAVSRRQLVKITALMLAGGSAVGLCMFLFSDLITVGILGQDYAPAAQVVRVLSLVTVLLFVNAPLSSIVQSSRYLKRFLPWSVTNTLLNIILNLLLIPWYGFMAAAWVMFITELSGTLINLYFARKATSSSHA